MDFLWQAWRWYGLISWQEYLSLHLRSYKRQLALVRRRATEKGKEVVVREWVWGEYEKNLEFHPDRYGHLLRQPSDRSFLVVRNPIRALASVLRTTRRAKEGGSFRQWFIKDWMTKWCKFHDAVPDVVGERYIRFEDLLADPAGVWKDLSETLGIDYQSNCVTSFHECHHFLGDMTRKDTTSILPANEIGLGTGLTESEKTAVTSQASEVARRFGYSLDD